MAFFSGLAATAGWLWAGLGGALVRAAIGVGLSLLGNQLSKKKQSKTQTYENGVKGTLQGGGDIARSFIMGRTVTAGSLIYANTWGGDKETPNAFLTQVIAISDMPVQGITAMWVDGNPVTIDNDSTYLGFGHPIKEYNNKLWIHFHDGNQTVANSMLTGVIGSFNNRSYANSRIGRGMAYVVITAQADAKIFSGTPSFKFEVEGLKLYDPSKDSSIGGNGSHRLADQSTWGGDGDHLPAVQIYNLLLGIYRKNSLNQKKWFYGFQNMSQVRLPNDNWIKAVNFCREQVQGPSGLEPRFLSGLEVSVDAENLETLDALRAACNADLIDTGGQYRIVFAEPDTPVMAFTDGDIISDDAQQYIPFHSIDSSINGITASYPEPEEGWNSKVATPVYSDIFEDQDGGRRLLSDIKLTAVYRWSQVQRLMQSSLKAARRERKHVLTLPYKYSTIECGDIIVWTSKRNFYSNKQFRVDDIVRQIGQNITITISEVDPNDFAIPDNYVQPTFTPTLSPRPVAQPIVGWYAEPSEILDNSNNARRPAIKLHWDGNQVDIWGIQYEVVLTVNSTPVASGRIDEYEVGVALIAHQAILPNTTYYVRGRYIGSPNRDTLWSEWLVVKTANIRLSDLDVYFGIDIAEINKKIDGQLKWLADGQEYIYQNIERMDKLVADMVTDQYSQVQVLKREINSTVGNVRAGYREEISVVANQMQAVALKTEELSASVANVDAKFTERTIALANDVEAWANRTTTIESKINDPGTGLQANATAISSVDTKVTNVDGRLTAVSNRVDTTQAQVGNVSANGLFRVTTEVNNVGGSSRIGLSAAVTTGSVTKKSALFITADSNDVSYIQAVADRFILTSEGYSEFPFIFAEGKLRLNAADIGRVQAGEININNRFSVSRSGEVIIRSSENGARLVMNNSQVLVYDGNNTLRVQLGLW
ncbi:phage tail protein [Bartonella sp. HY329]|uniref:phage tail protein n=1 Tax=unclassified Bartonella TaxID=2645622 RepID=UPI0021C87055|nr:MULTISPECIES: phage tail protein [unclassified Bartonella]UXM94637.1 phage tail protein [Bartonella sp. HY329]UXN08960.1 phage tail protein [Bartonella sp. HY328]